jgi:Domain of unknown function DUF29
MTNLRDVKQTLYEADFVAWADEMAALLQQKRFSELDLANLVEEIQDLGNRHRDALESNFTVVLTHLLKWQYQPEMRTGSWRGSIVEHRRRVNKALKNYPSLQPYLLNIIPECYSDAVEQAIAETGLTADLFPQDCLYNVEQVLDSQFLPAE